MKKRVVLVGAGGFGRGVFSWMKGSPIHLATENVGDIVFIDDRDSLSGSQLPWIGAISDYKPLPGDEVLCAVGSPRARKKIVGIMQDVGAKFHTFKHDSCIIGDRVEIGPGSIVCPGVVISADTNIGAHVHVNFNSSVGHDVNLGAFVTISPAVNIMGETSLGPFSFVGGSATILPRLIVGSGAIIGAGTVVLRDVRAGETVVGNPGRTLH